MATWHTLTSFFGRYGYLSIAIFRVHAPDGQAMRLALRKDFVPKKKMSFGPSEVMLPFTHPSALAVEVYTVLVLVSGLLSLKLNGF